MSREIYEKQKRLFESSKEDVKLFCELAVERDYNVFFPTKKEDVDEFWDTGIEKYNKPACVQVKGYTDAHKHNYVQVELVSKQKDRLGRNIAGWLYGKAKILALLFDKTFMLYDMRKLKKYIEETVDFTLPILMTKYYLDDGKTVDYEKMKYRQYNRWGDVMVAVPIEDIEHLKITEWKKISNNL